MSDIDNNENILKLLEIRLLHFFFTIPHEVVFQDFAYFLGTTNLKYNSWLVRTIFVAFTIFSITDS